MVAVCLCLLDQSPPFGPQDASPQPRQGHATVPLVVRQWVGSSPPPLRAPLPGPLPDRLVEDETYLWVLTRYVHLNPVRAGLSATPEAWIWSSCPGYFRRRDRLDWVAYDALLAAWAGEFGRTDPEASYRRFVAAGLTTPPAPPWAEARHGWLLGSERFLDRLRQRLGDQTHRDLRRERRLLRGLDLARVIEAVCSRYGVNRGQLAARSAPARRPALPSPTWRSTIPRPPAPSSVPILRLSRPESVPNLSARFAALLQSESNTRRDLLALELALGLSGENSKSV